MPNANGQLQLQDYDAALVARGFDAYTPAERIQLINFGYRYLARKYPWAWESSSHTFHLTPGSGPVAIAGASTLGADNVDQVFIVTNPYRRKLRPMDQDRFEKDWLPLDQTDSTNFGIPGYYYVFNGQLYVLAPPTPAMDVLVYFKQFLLDMVNATDTPVFPQVLDEVLMNASLARAHERAHETDLAMEMQAKVDEAIMDMLQDDVWVMSEQQERVIPDNQWL